MTDSIPNEKSDFNQLPSSASGWATQRNNAWFYVSPRIVPLSEAKDFWKLSAATDKSLILDTYFLTNTRWAGQNRPPHHVVYKNEKGVSINSICWGTVGKDANSKQQIYTNWVQPVVVHFTTTDAYINCIQLSNRRSESGNICAGNRNPGVNNDPHFTDNDFIHWNSDLIQKMGSSRTIAYWLQNVPNIYNYRDFYLIVPANARIQLGLKALDYTSYIGGVITDDDDVHKATPTSTWLAPNFRSVSWGGLWYVPIASRTVNDDFHLHSYKLSDATPIYSNANTKIKTYTDLLAYNNLWIAASKPSNTSTVYGASDNNWFYGLRNPYGTYGFAKNSSNIVNAVWDTIDGTSKITSLDYSTYGLLGEDDKIFVQDVPVANANVSIDNSTILIKPDGYTNVGTRFYSNALGSDPCIIDFAIPKPPFHLITYSSIPAKYQDTNSNTYGTTQFYAWGSIGTKVYPDILKPGKFTVTEPNNQLLGHLSGTLFNPHDRAINYRWGYDNTWNATDTRQPYTNQSWSGSMSSFETTGAKWRIYKLQAQLANDSSSDWQTITTYAIKNSKTYTIKFTIGTGRIVEIQYRTLLSNGNYSNWTSTSSTSISLYYGDQIQYRIGYNYGYSDGLSTDTQGPTTPWTTITVTADKTITIDNASHTMLSVSYGRNLESISGFIWDDNETALKEFRSNTSSTKSWKYFWIPLDHSVTIHYRISSSYSYTIPTTGWNTSSSSGSKYERSFVRTVKQSPLSVDEAQTKVYVPSYTTGYRLNYKIGTYSDWFSWGEKKALVYSNRTGECYVKNSSPSGTSNTTIGSYTYQYRSGGTNIANRFGGKHSNSNVDSDVDYYKGNADLTNGQHGPVGGQHVGWVNGSMALDPASFQIYFYKQPIGSGEPYSFSNFYNNSGPSGHGAMYLIAYSTTYSYYHSYTTKNAY